LKRNCFQHDPGFPGKLWRGLLAALAVLTLTLSSPQAAPSRTDTTFLTVDIDGSQKQLEVMMARPATGGPFPVALITHGTGGAALAASAMRPEATFGGWVRDFANRGYFAVGVMRRGYGRSDGAVTRDAGTCEKPDLRRYFERDADDLAAVLAALATWPDVDVSRLVVVGQSAGGIDSARQRALAHQELSTERAHWRPSRMAQTTSDWPRRMSPQAKIFSAEVL
jgi:dienelactone hydrolase